MRDGEDSEEDRQRSGAQRAMGCRGRPGLRRRIQRSDGSGWRGMTGGPGELVGAVLRWLRGVLAVAEAHGWWLVTAAVCGASVCAAGWVWWRRRAARELRRRVTFDLVPAATFDPSLEEVTRRAAQLGRVSAASGVLPRRAAAVRFRTACVEGKLASQVEGPARAAGVLRLSPYPQVQVVDAGTARRPKVGPISFDGAAPLAGKGRAA